MSAAAEVQLLARCREGDAAAWDDLFDLHYAAAGRFIFQLGYSLNREDVEEICQETFLMVIRNLNTFKGNCQFQTWLFRIAANKARDYHQRQHAAKRGGGQITLSLQAEDPDTGFTLDPPSELPGPESSLSRQEDAAMIGQALEELGDPCHEIISLRYFADLSYEEIANSLMLNPKTVSSRLSKCLDKLELVVREIRNREKKTPSSV